MNRTKKTTSNGRSVEDKQQRARNINNVEPLQRHGWLSLNAHVARLTHSTEVRYLDISDVVLSASEWSWLVDIIPTMANLEVLSLCGNALTDEQVSSLLQHVMPRGSSSGPLGVAPSRSERRYATPNTAGLQYLQVLSLASNRLTYKSMSTMYRFVLWHTATLTALDLSDNPLRDHGAHVLAIGLAKQSLHPLLDHLTRAEAGAATTSWFPVPFQSRVKKVAAAVRRRDAPTAAIAEVFGGLTVLSLARCRVSIRGVHDVLRSIVHIPNLTSVDMSENTVTYTTPLSAFDNDITAQHHAHGGSAGGIAVLESLNLSGCLLGEQLTPSGAHEMLLWVLFHATHLRELHLADSHRISASTDAAGTVAMGATRIGDVVAELMFQVSENSHHLRHASLLYPSALASLAILDLSSSGLSDEGARTLTYALVNRPDQHFLGNLVALDVSRNYLSIDGALDLLDAILLLTRDRKVYAGGREVFILSTQGNCYVDSMAEVDELFDAAVTMLYETSEEPSPSGKTPAERVHFYFGPCVSQQREQAPSFSCAEYCRQVRRKRWPYPEPHAPNVAVKRPSVSSPPSQAQTAEMQRSPRQNSPQSPARQPIINPTVAEDAWGHQRRAPSPRRDLVGASEILGSTGVSPIRHVTVDDASVDQHHHDVYDQHLYQYSQHTQLVYDPYAEGSPRGGIYELSDSRTVHQRPLASRVTPANDAERCTVATATTTVTNEHHYADHIEVQHNLSTSLTRRPLVSPERTDDEPQPEGHVVLSHHDEHELARLHHDPHHQGTAQADSYHHHQQLDITEELQEPAKETVQQQPTGIASPPTSPLKNTVPCDAAAQRRAERRVALESVQTDTTAPNPYDNNRNDVVAAPAPFADSVQAPPPSADNDHNNSSTLVITAADKAAARKTRLAANRARRRKLLGDASGDILGEEVPAASMTNTPVDDVTPPPIEAAAPPPPQVVDTPSPITPQSPQLHREEGVNSVVAVNHVAPLALPEIIPRDPSLLKGRVKNFTLTYHHPPGHLFCRMWSALSGSLGKEVARLSAAALGGDFLALLQPDKDETAYTVDSVTASVHADALSIDLSIATNEKRATVAQRLQDAAGLGSAPYDISDKNALATLPADHFPRCCRILSGYTIEGSPLPVDPTATTTHCTVDLLGAVMTAAPDALPHAVIEQCGGVLEWFHYHHGRESEIVELLPSDHVAPTQQSDQQAAPVNVVESVHSPPRVEREALFNPATETTPHHSNPSPAHEKKEESLQVSPKSPEDLRPSPESTAVFNHNNDEGNDLSLQLANIPDTPPPTATNEVGGGATFLASVVNAPIDEDRLRQDDVSPVSLEFEEDLGSKATPQPDPPSEVPPPEDFTTNDNVPQVVVEDLQLADRSGGSNNITLSSVSLIPADIPWALPNPATEEDSHSTTAEHAAYPLPDVVVKWTTAGGGLSLRTPQNGRHAGIIGSVLRTLHGGGHRIQRCMSPSGDDDASTQIVSTHHQQHNTSRPTTPSPPPPDSPASPHGIVDASPGNIWGLSNIPSPSNEGPVGTHHRNSRASNQAHDDGDDSEVDPLALGPLSELVQHRVAQDPALAFLKKHAGEVPSASASRFTTPVRRLSQIASNNVSNNDDGTASRTNSPPRRPPITAEQGVFRTEWQNAAEDILDRRPANLVVDPAVTADMLARRLKNIDRICTDSVKNGAVGLSYSARHKLRVCQGTMMLDKSALDRFNTGARVSSGAIVQPVADGTPSPAPRDRSNDAPSTPSSTLKVKPVRITLSVEWDGLLVLKRDDGAMAGKTVLLVYPLAYGVGSHSAGAGAAEGLGKELVVELRKPTLTEAEQQAQQHEVSNQALWGKVGNVSPSAPAANLARASDHSLLLRIDLGSHKKVEKALELLRNAEQSALKMVLQPPQQQQQTS